MLTVCNYGYVVMSLTLPGVVKIASLRQGGKELSHMRYDEGLLLLGGEGEHLGPAVGCRKFVPRAGLTLASGLPSATRGQDNTLLSSLN